MILMRSVLPCVYRTVAWRSGNLKRGKKRWSIRVTSFSASGKTLPKLRNVVNVVLKRDRFLI